MTRTEKSIAKTSSVLASKTASHSSAQFILDTFFARTSPRTVQAYKESLEEFARWLGADDVPQATKQLFAMESAEAHATVIRYSQWLQGLGADARKRPLAPSSVNLRLSALRSLTKLGNQLGACTWHLSVKGPKAGNVRDVRGPDVSTVRSLLKAAEMAGPVEHALLSLLFERGLRSIEARELQVKHLKLDATPPAVMVRGKGKTGLTALTVSASTAAALKKMLKAHVAVADDLDADPMAPDSFVFFGRKGPAFPLSKWSVWQMVKRVGESIDVKLWPHALRHSSLTALLDATNGDVRKVMKFSRHAHVQTLLKYDDERRDVGGELARELGKLTGAE